MLGKMVKKWIGQKKDIFSVCRLLSKTPNFSNLTPEECLKEYSQYIKYFNIKSNTSENVEKLLKENKKLHIYGETGSGKSWLIERVADKLGLNLIKSCPRSENDLLLDFGNFPFEQDTNSVFVMEGDAYYWRKYGLVKKYIEDSVAPVVIITIGKGTPTKWITKLLTQVKVYSPMEDDVVRFIQYIYPNFDLLNLKNVYSRDWRVVWRNLKYGFSTPQKKLAREEKYDAKTLAYKLIKGTAVYSDFDKCEHPISWVLNWLGYNAVNFWSGVNLRKNLYKITWCDAHKYETNSDFIKNELLTLIPSVEKGYMAFPPFKKKEEEKKEEKDYKISHYKTRITPKRSKKKKETEYTGLEDEIGDMMLI